MMLTTAWPEATVTPALAEPAPTITVPSGLFDELAASWMTPLVLLLAPVCLLRFRSIRRDESEAFDEGLLFKATFLLAFIRRRRPDIRVYRMSFSDSCRLAVGVGTAVNHNNVRDG